MLRVIVLLVLNATVLFGLSISPNIKMIVDVIDSNEKPAAIVAMVCWKSIYKIKLATALNSLQRPSNIRYLRRNETIAITPPNNHIFFVMDVNCPDIEFVLRRASASKLFSKTYRWLIFGKTTYNSEAVPMEIENLSILVDAEVVISRELQNKDFVLHKIYKVKLYNNWNVEYFGTWSMTKGLNKSGDISTNTMRRKDFKGESLTTATVISDNTTRTDLLGLGYVDNIGIHSFVPKFRYDNIYVDTVSKNTFRTVNSLYDFLNASRRVIFVDTWGTYKNESWNGMIGQIYSNEADLCGTLTFMQAVRMDAVEYLTRPTHITVKFVFRQPSLSYQNNLFILPFTASVWYCLSGFVVILMILLYINTMWDMKKYEVYEENTIDGTCLIPTWSDITIFVLSAISQQGSSKELKGTLGRFVMFSLFLSFVCFYTSYSANIIVLLQSSSNQIRTLSDLLNSKLELGVEDAAHNKYYFSADYARVADPVRRAIYETKIAPKGKAIFYSLDEGVKLMQSKPFAFNMNTGIGYRVVSGHFTEDEKCGLQEIAYIEYGIPWLCSRKFSPYSDMFKVGFLRIQEHGLSDRESRLIYANKPVCAFKQGTFVSVDMVDFYPLLLMLLYGMISSMMLLGIEILVHRKLKTIKSFLG